jgi:hypothetical protein
MTATINAAYGHPGAAFQTGPISLRDALNRRVASGQRLSLDAAVAQIVPLCLELADIHAQGYGFYLHPSSVTEGPDGSLMLARERASDLPSDPRDRACLPPETQPGLLNDARSNVYAMGAILYEMVTGHSVGRGMRRPSEVVPGLPKQLETVLSLTLIIDPERRPSDLIALSQSIHQLARRGTVPPLPEAVIHYHSSEPIAIDVSLSLLPPAPEPAAAANHAGLHPAPRGGGVVIVPAQPPSHQHAVPSHASHSAAGPHLNGSAHAAPAFAQRHVERAPSSAVQSPPSAAVQSPRSAAVPVPPASAHRARQQQPPAAPAQRPISSRPPAPDAQPGSVNGYGVAVQAAAPDRSAAAQAAQIAELKAQLESDTRPRYYVHKRGMDHGPFTALELARHIDGHDFTDEDEMVDSIEGRRGPIANWPPFALFAEHAKRNRQLIQRQKDIVKVAAAEKKSSRGKTMIGLLALLAILGAAGAWFSATTGERQDTVAIHSDESTNVETDDSLSIKGKKGGKSRRRASAGKDGIPVVSGGQSCEGAMDAYNEVKVMGERGQADLTAGQYGRVLNGGSYFSHCGVPNSMAVNICAAVQNGRAVGVTVSTRPSDPKKVSCITSAVRNLSFPSHPKLDVTRTAFAAQ